MSIRGRLTVCLDSNVFGWALKVRSDEHPEKSKRSRRLVAMLVKQNATLIIPTVVLGEVLTDCTIEERDAVSHAIANHFTIADYTQQAASLAADFLRTYPYRDSVHKGIVPRGVIKADIMVAASAKVAGCGIVYSDDAAMRKICREMGLQGLELPELNSEDLFESAGQIPVLADPLVISSERRIKRKPLPPR